ncbi:glycine-rich protein [Segatella paludivivens]|uniref:glycine-rich protein n=1 Tax=Segatella paludivivens TaxID=185294 RepID=UPI00035C1ADD|nr:glycine-rich protein [Segatella paludivivens]
MGKKSLRNINVSLLLLIVISLFYSCTGEMNIFEGNNNKQINFSVSVPVWNNTDSLTTTKTSRATPIGGSSLSTSNTFNLIADQNDGAGNYTTLINSQAVSYTNNIWKTSKDYYWSGIANKTISFYAYYPSNISNVSHTAGSSPTLSYTVPDKVSDQIDIMTATGINVSGNTNSSISLTFNHIFSAVQFNIGSSGMPNGTITGISLNNILYKGTYNFNGTWTQDATKKSFAQTVSSSTSAGTTITSGATTFMMMPQTLGSDASITVTYSNGGTLTKSISGTWTAGNIYTYNISKTIPIADFDYTGSVQTYTAPLTGTYKLEVWGAQGSSGWAGGISANGGYSYGNIYLMAGTMLYIYTGGSVAYNVFNGGCDTYNGGGKGAAPGGGASHIATTNRGVLSNYKNYQSEVVIVAGGAGGVEWSGTGGYGGGLNGGNGNSQQSSYSGVSASAYGGSQTSGGISVAQSTSVCAGPNTLVDGIFGQGGYGYQNSANDYGAGGGGGWYGGGGTSYSGAGGGGSGHLGSNLISGTTGMSNGVRSGNGYARITFISAN